MNSGKRRLLLTLLGFVTALAVWPAVELLLSYQLSFASYLGYFMALGGLSGILAGGFFGSVDGILARDFHKGLQGVLGGAFWGLFSGLIAFGAGQLFFLWVTALFAGPEAEPTFLMSGLARALSWAVFGVLLSLMEGIRCRSLHLLLVGALGGLLGGVIGGLALELLYTLFPASLAARAAGFILFFTCLGFFYSFFEWKLSWGILCLLNGPLKGREYLINQKRIRIGTDEFNDIQLPGYPGVAEEHANLVVSRGQLRIEAMGDSEEVIVNEESRHECELRYEDVFRLGEARFFLKVE